MSILNNKLVITLLLAIRAVLYTLIVLIIGCIVALSGFYIDAQIILVTSVIIALLSLMIYGSNRLIKRSSNAHFPQISKKTRLIIICVVGTALITINFLIMN